MTAASRPLPASVPRHYGLDWLRIAAFGLLIPYHIGMYFVPGPWVVKGPHVVEWIAWPLAALRPWRLPLLFLVSGYGARALLSRSDPLAFVRNRSLRLLTPLAFGMLVLVAPQIWVRVSAAGYQGGSWHFFVHDRIGLGLAAFGTEHLWFVGYLWAYCVVLVLALLRWPDVLARLDRLAAWLARRPLLFVLLGPAAAVAMAQLALLFVLPQGGNLFTDWHGHVAFMPPFLLGVALAERRSVGIALTRGWRLGLALGAGCATVLVAGEIAYPGSVWPPHLAQAGLTAASAAMGWLMLSPLYALAASLRHADHSLRRPLAEAVFPAYLVHQTLIVVIGWELEYAGLSAAVEFDILLFGTLVGCALVYLGGRELRWLRPLIGLAPRPTRAGAASPVRIAPAAP